MSLQALLERRIATQGPLSVADYMTECLLHPEFGYYTTAEPFGQDGDFTTAPEISQMFGELIGLSLAQAWLDQGRPAPFTLAELGPGRGTLMRDLLRAGAAVAGFSEAAAVWLIEASPRLRDAQRALLGDAVRHAASVDDLPEQPLFLVANEFFDALPIRQFLRAGRHWRERQIGVEHGLLAFGLGPETPQPALEHRRADTMTGDLVEYAPGAAPVAAAVGARIEAQGGAALIVDYGDWRSLGDSFQAVRRHRQVNPLAQPGKADLTAHVDFEALARAAPCGVSKLCPQGVFLERLGITARARKLAAGLAPPAMESHIAAHRRLTHPDEMGNLFKVLGFFASRHGPPPGLDT